MLILTIPGCENAEVSEFNTATRELNRMLTTTGNDDKDVLAVCAAVEEAYKRIDLSHVPTEQAAAMKNVALSAEFWKNQLTLMQVYAVQEQFGQDKSRDVSANLEIDRLMFPSIRSSVETYLKKYH